MLVATVLAFGRSLTYLCVALLLTPNVKIDVASACLTTRVKGMALKASPWPGDVLLHLTSGLAYKDFLREDTSIKS